MDAGRVVAGSRERDACARALRTANRLCIRAGTVRARGLVLPRTRPVTSLFTSRARPRWQIDQTDTRTLLHYAVMLRDKMAPQKVRASTGGDVTGNSGAQAALMLCAWLWLWQSEDAAEALKQQAEQLLQQVRPQALARMLARLRARMHAAWPVDTRIGTRPWASRTFMFRAASRVQHGRMSWPRVRN